MIKNEQNKVSVFGWLQKAYDLGEFKGPAAANIGSQTGANTENAYLAFAALEDVVEGAGIRNLPTYARTIVKYGIERPETRDRYDRSAYSIERPETRDRYHKTAYSVERPEKEPQKNR